MYFTASKIYCAEDLRESSNEMLAINIILYHAGSYRCHQLFWLVGSPAAEIGRQLARIGDDINERYKDTFSDMIRSMNIAPDSDTAYEAFAGVARKCVEF